MQYKKSIIVPPLDSQWLIVVWLLGIEKSIYSISYSTVDSPLKIMEPKEYEQRYHVEEPARRLR